jgi:hypothetical protein
MYGATPFGAAAFGSFGISGDATIYDGLILHAGLTPALTQRLSETLGFSTSFPPTAFTLTLEETLALAHTLEATEWATSIIEIMALSGTATAAALRLATLTETLNLGDAVRIVLSAMATETLSLTASAVPTRSALVSMVETLRLTGALTNTYRALATISEALALREVTRLVEIGDITDVMALTEAITTQLSAYEVLTVSLYLADTVTGMADVTVLVEESFELNDTITPTGLFLATITEGLDFSIGFVFDGEPYIGYSMNAATKALSTYTNYPFNSMATFNGRNYGASSEGLYRIGGADDAGETITWRLRTGMTNFGTGRNKGLDAAYLGYTADGRIALKCIIVSATGEKIGYWYNLTPKSAANPQPGRIPTGRGLKSVYMGFELTNVDASEIELDVIELHPIILEGRL